MAKMTYPNARQLAAAGELQLRSKKLRDLEARFNFVREWYELRCKSHANATSGKQLRKRLAAAKKAAPALARLAKTPALRLLLRQHGADPRTIEPLITAIASAQIPGAPRGRGGARHFGNRARIEAVEQLDEAFTALTGGRGSANLNPITNNPSPLVRFVRKGLLMLGEHCQSPVAAREAILRSRR